MSNMHVRTYSYDIQTDTQPASQPGRQAYIHPYMIVHVHGPPFRLTLKFRLRDFLVPKNCGNFSKTLKFSPQAMQSQFKMIFLEFCARWPFFLFAFFCRKRSKLLFSTVRGCKNNFNNRTEVAKRFQSFVRFFRLCDVSFGQLPLFSFRGDGGIWANLVRGKQETFSQPRNRVLPLEEGTEFGWRWTTSPCGAIIPRSSNAFPELWLHCRSEL